MSHATFIESRFSPGLILQAEGYRTYRTQSRRNEKRRKKKKEEQKTRRKVMSNVK